MATSMVTASARVPRGERSWSYFYMVLGLILALITTLVALADGIPSWARGIIILCLSGIVGASVLYSGRLQNALIRFKNSYENKAR